MLMCSVGSWAVTEIVTIGDLKYECNFDTQRAKVAGTVPNVPGSLIFYDADELTVPDMIEAKSSAGHWQKMWVNGVGDYAFKGAHIKRLHLPLFLQSLGFGCFYGTIIENIYFKSGKPTLVTGTDDWNEDGDPNDCLGFPTYAKPHLFVNDNPSVYKSDEQWTSQFSKISRAYSIIENGVAISAADDVSARVVEKEEPYTGDVVIPDGVIINGKWHSVAYIDEGVFEDSGDQMTSLTLGKNIERVGAHFLKGVKLNTLICKCTSAPYYNDKVAHDMNWGEGFEVGEIQVPYISLGSYREYASGWKSYADKIWPIPVVIDGIKYRFMSSWGEAIVMPNDYAGDIVIPETVTDYSYYESGRTFTVTELLDDAFYSRTELTSIELPSSLKKIGKNGFNGCSKLEYIKLPNKIKKLPDYCFLDCAALKYIGMPENLETIGTSCFGRCVNLYAITIPASVKELGYSLFFGTNIQNIEFADPTVFSDFQIKQALANNISQYSMYWTNVGECTAHMPTHLVDAYKDREGWNMFKNITDGPACKHWYEHANWLWEDYEGALPYAYFECDYCHWKSDLIAGTINGKNITFGNGCTTTGKYELTAVVTSPHGVPFAEIKEFVLPARHTTEVGHCEFCGQDILDYLAFHAQEGDVTVAKPENVNLQYSTERITWNDMESDVTIPVGSTYFFRNASDEVATDMAGTTLSLTSKKGKADASGNIMSLLDKTCESVTVGENGFKNLFKDCKVLTAAPELPATTLGQSAYESLFSGCTNLNSDFELPAETVSQDCYKNMFNGCSSMASVIITRAYQKPNDVTAFCTDWITGTATPKVYVTFGWDSNECYNLFTQESKDKATLAFIQNTKEEYDNIHDGYDWGSPYTELLAQRYIIRRSMTDDGWYTICLPFDIDIDATPFSQAAEFKSMDSNGFHFSTVTELKKGVGYLVKVDSDVPQLQFWNVTIPTGTERETTINGNAAFRGTFKPEWLDTNCYVIGTGTTVNPVAETSKIWGFRAYLITEPSAAKTLYFTVDDDVPTPVTRIDSDLRSSEGIYNLQGQRVDASHRGLLIKNGKKIVVK